ITPHPSSTLFPYTTLFRSGGGWKDVYRVDTKEELIWAYDQSGGLSPGYRPKTMILQEFIKWEDYIRCIAIGRKDVLPIRYDPTADRKSTRLNSSHQIISYA